MRDKLRENPPLLVASIPINTALMKTELVCYTLGFGFVKVRLGSNDFGMKKINGMELTNDI